MENNRRGTYVFFTAISNCITGGLIYVRNKIKYLKQIGWKVVVFPTNDGPVYIEGLEDYRSKEFLFLQYHPSQLNKYQLNYCIKKIVDKVQINDCIIIETGTDFTSYWGELLAARLNCRHIIFFLDEHNKDINSNNSDFFKFKYERKELSCISEQTLKSIFGCYFSTSHNSYPLKAYCSNSIEDIRTNLIGRIRNIKKDWCIGSIGRIEKNVALEVVKSVQELSKTYLDKKILVIFFGGGPKGVEKRLQDSFIGFNNVTVIITGYLFPIPLDCARECDVFVSTSGSARASANIGIPTIKIDMYDNKPLGIIINDKILK